MSLQNQTTVKSKVRLKKGDEVIVITGKDKGKSGTITKVLAGAGRVPSKVVLEGLNIAKKHMTAQQAAARQMEPGILDKPMPIAISNVMLKDPTTGKPTRVGYRLEADGSKVRVAKASNTVLVNGKAKAGASDPSVSGSRAARSAEPKASRAARTTANATAKKPAKAADAE